ncbi:MAG: regulatory protein RecX [Balneolales bacterium]
MPHNNLPGQNDDHLGIIPGVCSGLQVQKKNPGRISLFIEGEFVSGFHQQIILDYKLFVGKSITEELFSAMKQTDQRYLIKERCFDWLGRRAHSRGELKQKALIKNFSAAVIDEVLDELADKGYLDDQAFAVLFVRDKANIYGWGPQKITSALYQKGIKKRYIEAAIKSAVTDNEIMANLYKEVRKGKKKFLRIDDPLKRKKKLVDFLRRKGYTLDSILSEAESLLKSIEDEKL